MPRAFQLRLLVTTACVALGAGGGALAQNAAPGSNELTEIVVTASRQGEAAISKVPMSIVATTQASIDTLSIKSSQDLARVVPGLRIIGAANGGNGPNVSIRGVQSTTQGAATTGIYIDDSPLQARTLSGLVTGGGTFLPILFDLQRVEVLKGPQGTLYGSSSEGGTIRYITPDPSLSNFSYYGKAEVNTINQGQTGGEAGGAIGGPIIADKLGFRGSVFYRRIGGWVDHVDWRTGGVIARDTNGEEQQAGRLALLWKPTERLTIKPAFYYAKDVKDDADTIYNSVPAYTTPAIATVLATGAPYLGYGPACPTGTLQAASSPTCTDQLHRGLLPPGFTAPSTLYVHPAHTYGPINLGPYSTLVNTDTGLNYTGPVAPKLAARTSTISLASLNLALDTGPVLVQSVTSWLHDLGDGYGDLTLQEPQNTTVTVGGGYAPSAQSPFIFDLPGAYESSYFFHARRYATTEELRLSSNYQSPLTWTGGVYYQSANTTSHSEATQNRTLLQQTLLGHSQLGIQASHSAAEIASNLQVANDQQIAEERYAVFGEVNYMLTRRLKLTAGVRWSTEKLGFSTYSWGLLQPGTFTDRAARTLTGNVVEHPLTPKFSASYQLTDDDLVYATAAKGFRPGGVQPQASLQCATDLAQLGLTSTPATFGSDSVWSYETGAKVRMLDRRVSLAGSVFRVDWDRPQTPYLLPTCVFSYLTNIGSARSEGFDLQGDVLVAQGLRANFNLGYTHARYMQDVLTVPNAAGQRTPLVYKGQDFVGIPKWQFDIGLRYDTRLRELPVYAVVNWQHIGSNPNATPAGTSGYAPDAMIVPAMNYVTGRLGFRRGDFDLSLFADNLLNEGALTPATLTGRASCRYPFPGSTSCNVYSSYYAVTNGSTFRPRMIGITATFRR
jgi:iron complex outermembrane receptor protein